MRSAARIPCIAPLLLAALACWVPAARDVAAATGSGSPAAAPRPVFDALARAWNAEDHAALAARIAADGVDIALGPGGARNHYSPSQAYYFFKNLFQTTETDGFRCTLLSEEPEAGLVHAVAEWSRRRAGEEGATVERLIITLARGETGWGLAGIRTIR